jgi:RNA polymerase sigma factor (sigma-70 family)
MNTDDDATLLQACQAGNAEAWEVLVRRYQRLIYAIPRRAGLNDDLTAEVFQQVCVILFEHLGRIEQPERLAGWLATTARRESLRQLRREGRFATAREYDPEDDGDPLTRLADPALLPDEMLERLERQQTVRRALAQIDERCRNLLTMLFYRPEAPLYSEIAAALQISEGSIGPTRARCLQKLRKVLGDEL